ncbi:nitroreductase family protein [Mesoplasma corruscae]|uniref:NAD(P)H-dependent oxidoreductase n=1 Tax=Mesoplasma corruscae TaxID=216874 RepID=A0A2S5RGG6_9MOLU|nr:nitroreductase family protein [Mesoplasma corruscae]PPE06388.1 NAD(P)H-dependent oxidoreductase [Mesoplasma corruscae]
MSRVNELMLQRRSAREFDTNYKIPEQDLKDLVTSIRMSPSAFGLLTQRLVVIQDKDIQKELEPLFWNQVNFVTASAILLFIGTTPNGLAKQVQITLDKKFGVGIESEMREKFTINVTKNLVDNDVSDQIKNEYSIKQSFISSGVATVAAANLGIDTCIIEGYDTKKLQSYLVEKKIINENESPYISMVCGKSIRFTGEKLRLEENEFVIWK